MARFSRRPWRIAARWLGRFLGRWVPAPVAGTAGGLAVIVGVVGLFNGLVYERVLTVVDDSLLALNEQTPPDRAPPASTLLSGGTGSLMTWQSLGRWGRDFVAGGPTLAQLERFSGRPATQPIRVYSGLGSRESLREEAQLAVAELQRTGGFTRAVLVVVTTTGMGWVNSQAIDAIEYMYNGDSAVAGLQYSYLPSWLSFLVDQTSAGDAGRELFDAVHRVWSDLPEAERPALLVVGESLGSFGSESGFSGLGDVVDRTQGALWVGPLNFNPLRRELTAARDDGSSEARPVYDGGGRSGSAPRGRSWTSPPRRGPTRVWCTCSSRPIPSSGGHRG